MSKKETCLICNIEFEIVNGYAGHMDTMEHRREMAKFMRDQEFQKV